MHEPDPRPAPAAAPGAPTPDAVLAAVRQALGPGVTQAALHEPEFDAAARAQVLDCLDSGWVSTVGAWVGRFEQAIADTTGAAHVSATVNGTAALHLALRLVGVQPGDEVLLPSLTFVATANAVAYCGATPHFVDVEARSFGVDAVALEAHLQAVARVEDGRCLHRASGATIRALVVMHCFGHPADLDALAALAERWQLALVEDAAESLGSFYKGRHTGRHGRIAALSFNGNKIVTTGGGGAVFTDDPLLGARARHLSTTARVPAGWRFEHDEIGHNYRLPNLNAALGCAQMAQLPRFVEEKRVLADRYRAAFAAVPGLRFAQEPADTRSNYWLNAIVLERPDAARRDALLQALNDAGFMSRPIWTPMHALPMYRSAPRAALPVTEALAAQIINLPSSPRLGRAAPGSAA